MAYDAFYLTYKRDHETIERFENISKRYPNFQLVKINLTDWNDNKIEEAIKKLSTHSKTKFFWVIDADVLVDNDFDFNYEPNEYEQDVIHLWNAEERNVFRSVVGIKLFNKSLVRKEGERYIRDSYYMTGEFKLHEEPVAKYQPTKEKYDIFFWDKGYGKENKETLLDRFPDMKIVTGDTNIDVHNHCREHTVTDFYYLVTGNTVINDDFNFDYSFEFGLDKENQKVVVWRKSNPVTSFGREYHGVGLFPKDGEMFDENDYKIFNFGDRAVYEAKDISSDLKFPVIVSEDIDNFDHDVDADMYWLVTPDVQDLEADFYPFEYDRDIIHNFRVRLHNGKAMRGGVRLVPKNADVDKQKDIHEVKGVVSAPPIIYASTLQSGLEQITEYPTLIVDPAVKLKHSFSFYPEPYDKATAFVFNVDDKPGGVVYVNKPYDENNVKFLETNAATYPEYDIFFWDQGFGRKNLTALRENFDVKSIKADDVIELHKLASDASMHEYYYIVTGDTLLSDEFKFDYKFSFSMTDLGRPQIVVWMKTDKNGEKLGYHGVGLFRKNYAKDITPKRLERFDFRKRALYIDDETVKFAPFDVVYSDDLFDMSKVKEADSAMVWVVRTDIEDLKLEYEPLVFDKIYAHNFLIETVNGRKVRSGVRLVPRDNYDDKKQKDVDQVVGKAKEIERVYARTVKEAIELAQNDTFWVINPDLELTGTQIDDFYPDLYDTSPTHIWKFKSRSGEILGFGGLILANKNYHPENMIYHEDVAAKIPDEQNIPVFYSRDMYDVYKNTEGAGFYWVVDTVVELVNDFSFDFYPSIHEIENVFTFKSDEDAGSGVYLVYRPHLAEYNPSERDFSFDRFKKIITIDKVVSKVAVHPAYYFDEGLYSNNKKSVSELDGVNIIDASNLADAYMKAATESTTGYFWALDEDASLNKDFNRSHYVDRHHRNHIHMWPKQNPHTKLVHQFGGLRLVPSELIIDTKPDSAFIKKSLFKSKKPIKADPATSDIPFDVIFLSYNEPFADENYEKLLNKVPGAKRVHGVKGIFNAHKEAAELADTKMFYVVDADAILVNEFEFSYFPTVWDEDIVHTWKSRNPINDLVYGYGGLKLFPTKLLREAKDWHIDFTTSVAEKFKPMPTVANYTAFNTDPFNTWKSAFRECTKLSASVIKNSDETETLERLEAWCTKGEDRHMGKYAIAGAISGREYGKQNVDNPDMLSNINDFEWLKSEFNKKGLD
jgi:hypothetical protein